MMLSFLIVDHFGPSLGPIVGFAIGGVAILLEIVGACIAMSGRTKKKRFAHALMWAGGAVAVCAIVGARCFRDYYLP
jgi:hypothetical protein